MKIIKYNYHTQANHGTADKPKMVDVITPVKIECFSEESFQENLEMVKKEAYNGEYTIEEKEE